MAEVVQLARECIDVADRNVVAMSQPVSTVTAETTLTDAMRALLDVDPKHLVVVDRRGRLVGVLGGRQLVAAWAGGSEECAITPVTAVLDSVPPIVAPTATLRTVARVMRDHGSDVVVVVGQGRAPVGVVAVGDLVALIAGSD